MPESTEESPLLQQDKHSRRASDEESQPIPASTDTKYETTPQRSAHTIISILVLGVFVTNLDGSLVLATSGIISSQFDNLADSGWLVTSYTLAICAVQPICGKLSDIYGRRNVLAVSYLLFAVGCAVCGLGASLSQVILGRVIGGIGGAGMGSLVSILIADLVPLRDVASWRSYVNIAAMTGRSLGGPVGGFLADTIGWRWSFLGQCPVILFALVMIVQKLPSSASPGKGQEDPASVQSQRSKLARVDFLGGGLLAAATVAFVLALDLGGQNVPWDAPLIVILSVSALVLGGLFLVVEGYWAKEPVFPIRLLVHRDVVTSYLIAGLQVAAGIGVLFSVPWYFQVTANASAVAAGAYLIPAVVGNAAGSVFTGLMIRRTGRYKSLILLGPAISAIGYLLLILRWRGRTNLAELMYIIVGEFGNAISQSSGIIGLMAGVESLDIAVAGTGFAQSQSIGVIVGLTLNMATLQSSLRPMLTRHLQDVPNRQSIIDQATSNIEYVKGLTGGLREVVVTSYVTSLMYTHVLSLTFSVLAFGVALFVKEYKL